ncbi:hypothetical protein Droror1_Dr00017578 [Drosera rotundifolia]
MGRGAGAGESRGDAIGVGAEAGESIKDSVGVVEVLRIRRICLKTPTSNPSKTRSVSALNKFEQIQVGTNESDLEQIQGRTTITLGSNKRSQERQRKTESRRRRLVVLEVSNSPLKAASTLELSDPKLSIHENENSPSLSKLNSYD